MIEAIFLARFLSEKGTQVIHQSPAGSIVPEAGIERSQLFDFDTVARYIIPRQAFCNRYVTFCDPNHRYRVLGHPVCIKNEKYERNEFMFNFCLVIAADVDKLPYEGVAKRLASTFTEMEIQTRYLSQEDASYARDHRSISALLEIIMEDLNNYNECMIPVDDANTINMKLFPYHRHPPNVKSWHVPIAKIKFEDIVDDTWDLTMRKVVAHIDGIKDVRRIAHDADVALDLTKIALQHLLYYESILLLDLFLFGNVYAPTPDINDFIEDKDGIQDECANYVCINGPRISKYYLCRLYTSLCTSRTLKEWLKMHNDQGLVVFNHIDVRRFIQFGVIKGLIYRVHKFVVSQQYLASIVSGHAFPGDGSDVLQKYMDGCHSLDQIITELNMSDTKIMEQLRRFPTNDTHIIYR